MEEESSDLMLIILLAIQERGKSYLCSQLLWKDPKSTESSYFMGLTELRTKNNDLEWV